MRDINFRGVKIAREAREVSGEPVFLAGSVSSIGQPLAPVGTIAPDEARAIFIEQIEALLEAGVDLLVLETFSSPLELREAVRAARSVSADLPIVAEVSVDEDGNTLAGATPAEVVELPGPTARGRAGRQLRCRSPGRPGRDPADAAADRHAAVGHAQRRSPDDPGRSPDLRLDARLLRRLRAPLRRGGVSIIGGCCGTTPRTSRPCAAYCRATARRPRSASRSRPRPPVRPPTMARPVPEAVERRCVAAGAQGPRGRVRDQRRGRSAARHQPEQDAAGRGNC